LPKPLANVAKMPKRVGLSSSNRRRFLRQSSYLLAACGLAACSQDADSSNLRGAGPQASSLRSSLGLKPTPACGTEALTPRQTPGPFYHPDSPQRQSLITAETVGTRWVLAGQVLTTDCAPVPNCLIDVWQTDAQGDYDNEGNQLRGHQFTDAEGRYWLETIVPGIYPGRTRHLHVRVQAPELNMLTTQLYFPQEPLNDGDFLFRSDLLMAVQETPEEKQAQFDFVLG